ncbi:unnamed protein product [Acanthoscelides obtectus]|uniref:Uncharacterized protein n=1 Tax=Acanthoscelides obtectus TaxID=200917 RepID=A0A9P0MLV2_ACAOB|nr:unnamed protein product [Acanthoscelides obtectus]CAK1627122.1 hypothetical protein AOBTE_LOCUS4321 [Acanthoscelides obtectus]
MGTDDEGDIDFVLFSDIEDDLEDPRFKNENYLSLYVRYILCSLGNNTTIFRRSIYGTLQAFKSNSQ